MSPLVTPASSASARLSLSLPGTVSAWSAALIAAVLVIVLQDSSFSDLDGFLNTVFFTSEGWTFLAIGTCVGAFLSARLGLLADRWGRKPLMLLGMETIVYFGNGMRCPLTVCC